MGLMLFLLSFAALILSFVLFWSFFSKKEKRKWLEAEERLIRELELEREKLRVDRVPTSSQPDVREFHPKDMALAIKKLLLEDSATEQGKTRDPKEFTGRQKAAALLVTMGTEFGAEMCKYLREDEIEILAHETAKPESYDIKQQIAILKEFKELMTVTKYIKAEDINKTQKMIINKKPRRNLVFVIVVLVMFVAVVALMVFEH
jgi:hypothetical protein